MNESPEIIIKSIREKMNTTLFSLDYEIMEEEKNGAFGSYYVTFKNNKKGIRFVWDNRERWFVLEQTDDLKETAVSEWSDLILLRMPRSAWSKNKTEKTIKELEEEINKIKR